MRTLKSALWVALLLVAAPGTLQALRISGTEVVIPVVMHGPGAEGTEWRTDLWISNWNSVNHTVEVAYYPEGSGTPMAFTVPLQQWTTVEITDVVLTRFGLDNSKGLLILTSQAQAFFEARARIYNTGHPSGEFGQFVPGLATGLLNRQAYLPGLSGVDGNRTNVGIANPMASDIEVTLWLYGPEGADLLVERTVTVAARSVLQINDVFGFLGVAGRRNAQLNITGFGELTFYGYASVVRAGTGDAIFIFGTSPNY